MAIKVPHSKVCPRCILAGMDGVKLVDTSVSRGAEVALHSGIAVDS